MTAANRRDAVLDFARFRLPAGTIFRIFPNGRMFARIEWGNIDIGLYLDENDCYDVIVFFEGSPDIGWPAYKARAYADKLSAAVALAETIKEFAKGLTFARMHES